MQFYITKLLYSLIQEMRNIIISLVFTLIRGFTWPAFSIVYGQLFKILSAGGDDVSIKALLNSLWFILLAFTGGISTLISGSLLGKAGETMSGRLRMDVFRVCLSIYNITI